MFYCSKFYSHLFLVNMIFFLKKKLQFEENFEICQEIKKKYILKIYFNINTELVKN